MAFPTLSSGRVDKQLSNISLAYTNDNYIHDKILPLVPNLKEESGKIGTFGNEHLRVYESVKTGLFDESSHRIEYKQTNTTGYQIDYFDMDAYVPDRLKNQLQKPFDAKRDALDTLEEARNVLMEDGLATALADATVLTNTSTPSALWDDQVNSDPLLDIETACEAIRAATGRRPNKSWTNSSVISKLQTHPQFIDKVRGINVTLSKQQVVGIIMDFCGLKELHVGSAIKITSKEGQATETKGNIWQDDFGLYYAPDRASLRTPAFGYRFELSGQNKRVSSRRNKGDRGDDVRLEWAFQDKILDVDSAYLLDQVIT